MPKNTTDKMIPDPENPEEMIENPDYIEPASDDDDNDLELTDEDQAKLDKLVAKQLKQMKGNMDRLDAQKKEAERRVKEFEEKERKAEVERLKAEGKLIEAHQLEMQAINERLKTLEETNTKLTRDNVINSVLASYDFRSEKARKAAQREITDELTQNDKGEWIHNSGKSISEYVKTFMEAEENSFLLKPKRNTGGGSGEERPGNLKGKEKSLKEMSQDEVLQRVRERLQRRSGT